MVDQLARVRQLRAGARPLYGNINPTTDIEGSLSNMVQDTQRNLNMAYQNSPRAVMERQQAEADAIAQNVQLPEEQSLDAGQYDFSNDQQADPSAQMQGNVIPGKVPVTQEFGRYNPGLEPNKSGRNWGVDFGVKEGTPLALPPGEWEVVQAFDKASGNGYIGNRENTGYGNSVLVRNPKTGETMRFSHLSNVKVQPGQRLSGGTVIGASGATGNVTGPHLDLEYKDASGNFRDILKSRYASNLFGSGGGSPSYGSGGGIDSIGNAISSLGNKARSAYEKLTYTQPNENKALSAVKSLLFPQQAENEALVNAFNTDYRNLSPEEKRKQTDMMLGRFTDIAGVKSIGGPVTQTTKAISRLSPEFKFNKQLDLIENALKKTSKKGIDATEALDLIAKRELSPDALEIINKQNPVGNARNKAILSELRGIAVDENVDDVASSLATEAKKYKSAEEFVKAQGEPVFHGTASKFEVFDPKFRGYATDASSAKGAFWFTDDPATAKAYAIYAAEDAPVQRAIKEAGDIEKIAQRSGKKSDWVKYDKAVKKYEDLATYDNTYKRRQDLANVKEAYVKGDFLEIDAKGKTPQELSTDANIDSWLNNKVKEAQKSGKAGLKIINIDDAVGLYNKPSTHYAVFNPDQIKTKSQLTDIYNQAKGLLKK